jgi:hypothetical protein
MQATALRIGLVVFVLAWLFGPFGLRSYVPVWLPFLIALGLELQFFLGARTPAPARDTRTRLPQAADRERWGYAEDPDELLLVRDGGEELWIPYSGETEEEVEELIAEARERAALGELDEPALPPARRRGPHVRGLLTGLAVIAALVAVVWVV